MDTQHPEQQQIIALVNKSREISYRLEGALFKIWPCIVDLYDNIDVLIATFDLENGLCMAPVTNLESTYLKKFIGDTLLLYFLRNELAFTDIRPEEPSTARWLFNALKQGHGDDDRDSVIYLARIAPSPESNALAVNLAHTPAEKVTVAIPDKVKGVADSVRRLASDLSKQGKNVDLVVSSFSVKLDETTVIPFAHLGLWAVSSQLKAEEVDKEYSSLLRSIHFSRMTTLSILLERQRYFEKSIRQSVSGRIIKYGDSRDINTQTKMFRDLHEKKVYIVPLVIDDFSYDGKAWYLMPKYSPPSLMNLFSRTDGFEEFETKSIVMSAFKCLTEQLYSRDTNRLKPVQSRDFLYGPAALAEAAIKASFNRIKELGNEIQRGKPVKVGSNIEIFDKDYFKQLPDYIEIIKKMKDKPGEVKCTISGKDVSPPVIPRNLLSLDGMKAKIGEIPNSTENKRVRTKDDRIHGDAHFGNFLIDASIPECPLIYLIDVKNVKVDIEEAKVDLEKEQKDLIADPLYDFAMMLLSCSCGYDLANRNGFRVKEIKPNDWKIELEYSVKPSLEKQYDKGGLSDTQIVNLESGVAKDGCKNYRIASETLCDIITSWLRQLLPKKDNSYAVSLLKIWFLTVRHAFSMVGYLFPKYPDRSLAMLSFGLIFVKNGKDCVNKALKDLRVDRKINDADIKCLERSLKCVLPKLD